jgi:DNA polymerase III subunit gamma/tau
MIEALHVRYRPRDFSEVVGQADAIKSLQASVLRNEVHSYLLTGPSGTGKTTIARIASKMLGAKPSDILEVDAASKTGVDDMRSVLEAIRYKPLGGKVRPVIIDEAHMLSRNAWNSMLKAIEEPPKHCYWFVCTTEAGKVPTTITTRCVPVRLKAVAEKGLIALVRDVCAEEKLKLRDDIIQLCAVEANGSARQALVNLELVRDVKDGKEAQRLLANVADADPVIALCRFLLDGKGSWMKVAVLLKALEEQNPEGVRIVVCNYMGSVLKGAKNERTAIAALNVLGQFDTPYNSSEGMAPLFLSVGRCIVG